MGVFVGVVHLRLGIELALDNDHHPLIIVVIETENLLAEQLELELGRVLIRAEQAEGPERERVLLALLRRVVLVEDPFQLNDQLVPADQIRGTDVGGRQAADRHDLGLDLPDRGEQLVVRRDRTARAWRLGGG